MQTLYACSMRQRRTLKTSVLSPRPIGLLAQRANQSSSSTRSTTALNLPEQNGFSDADRLGAADRQTFRFVANGDQVEVPQHLSRGSFPRGRVHHSGTLDEPVAYAPNMLAEQHGAKLLEPRRRVVERPDDRLALGH